MNEPIIPVDPESEAESVAHFDVRNAFDRAKNAVDIDDEDHIIATTVISTFLRALSVDVVESELSLAAKTIKDIFDQVT